MTNREGMFGAGAFLGFIGGAIFSMVNIHSGINERFDIRVPEESRPAYSITYDVNRDGLDDIVSRDGSVEIKQSDGTYLPIKIMIRKNFDELEGKYQLEKGKDGRYYTKGIVRLANDGKVEKTLIEMSSGDQK